MGWPNLFFFFSPSDAIQIIKGIKPTRDDFDDTTSVTSTTHTSVPKSGGTTAPQTN